METTNFHKFIRVIGENNLCNLCLKMKKHKHE